MNEKAAQLLASRKPAAWVAHEERGSLKLLRAMAFLSLRCGRRLSRKILYCIALYFFLFGPTARRSARRYLSLALGRPPRAAERFRQILYFATTIHDRVYLLNGRFDLFDINVEGEEIIRAAVAQQRGAMLLGAHMGSFEIVHALGRRRGGLTIAMAMYEENARQISGVLKAINPKFETEIVGLGHVAAMLNIAERLERGQFVGVLGDRTLGEEPSAPVTLLGEPARLPTGPLRAAAILRCPVYFMAGLYRGGNRYHIVFEQVADFSQVTPGERALAVTAAIERYASLLERCCRTDPFNWFNFFDFWHARP